MDMNKVQKSSIYVGTSNISVTLQIHIGNKS
jgi:hypothetical protein